MGTIAEYTVGTLIVLAHLVMVALYEDQTRADLD
jgi:hypothetical protein